MTRTAELAACAALCAALAAPAGAQPAAPAAGDSSAAVREHVAGAYRIAAPDAEAFGLGFLCQSTPGLFKRMLGMRDAPDGAAVITGKVFDNISYIGFDWVGTYLVDTGAGLILIDTLNSPGEAESVIVPSIRKLGFDPKDLKYVLLTHGHFDHFGGARYLQDRFGVRVAMGAKDWDVVEGRPAADQAKLPGPRRDVVLGDGDEVRLGNTVLKVVSTPGHSPGTVSLLMTGRWRGRSQVLTLAGGSAMPPGLADAAQYHDSFHKLWEAGTRAGAVGVLSTHPFMMGALPRLEQVRRLSGGGKAANPFVLGPAGYQRFMRAQDACIDANMQRMAGAPAPQPLGGH